MAKDFLKFCLSGAPNLVTLLGSDDRMMIDKLPNC